MFWLAEIELLYIGCMQVLLKSSFCFCENVSIAIVVYALIHRVQLVVMASGELSYHYKALFYTIGYK